MGLSSLFYGWICIFSASGCAFMGWFCLLGGRQDMPVPARIVMAVLMAVFSAFLAVEAALVLHGPREVKKTK